MAKITHIMNLSAVAILATMSAALAADTLADMDIEVSPELVAYGIDPGIKHATIAGRWQPVAIPQFVPQSQVGPVVILGDSIMAELGSWPGTVNLAVSGTTMDEILASAAKVPANASTVVIEGGFNNFKIGQDAKIVPDYKQAIATVEARAPQAKVEIIGILPVNDAQISPIRNANNAKIAAFDAMIAAICSVRCAVVQPPFGKSLPPTMNVGDGIHPNAAGIATLRKVVP